MKIYKRKSILSQTSKMPCPSFSVPLTTCQDSCVLGQTKRCYATTNIREYYKPRKEKLQRNLELLNSDSFVSVMTFELKNLTISHFRFFDTGDISDIGHLEKIVNLCNNLPNIKFWLPTHRDDIVFKYLDSNVKPDNLIIRISMIYPDIVVPQGYIDILKKYDLSYSVISTDNKNVNCHASMDGTNCGLCRNCWSNKNIVYKAHGRGFKKKK